LISGCICGGQFVGALASVGVGIGVFLTESIANALDNHKEQIKQALIKSMDARGDMYEAAGNIVQALGDGIYKILTSEGAIKIGTAIAGHSLVSTQMLKKLVLKSDEM